MLRSTYFAQNYAGIIRQGLVLSVHDQTIINISYHGQADNIKILHVPQN